MRSGASGSARAAPAEMIATPTRIVRGGNCPHLSFTIDALTIVMNRAG